MESEAGMLGAGLAGWVLGLVCVTPVLLWLRRRLARARWTACHDFLTGLPNRRAAQDWFERHGRDGATVWMALLDLDGFKQINDVWGHGTGDAYLAEIARRLATACDDQIHASRLGGDEFLLLLPLGEEDHVKQDVARVLKQLAAPLRLSGEFGHCVDVRPAASAGIAAATPNSTWSGQLHCADVALYHAKRGHGLPVVWAAGMTQPSRTNSREPRTAYHRDLLSRSL